MSEGKTRAGFIAIIGTPNAGKSTLVNRLVGSKLAIVSPKVQTTRTRLTAIAVRGRTQMIFVDTPGIFAKQKRRLERAMVEAAWRAVRDADLATLVVDAREGLTDEVEHIVAGLKKRRIEAILALNKVDLVKPPKLLELAGALNKRGVFSDVFMVSALTGDGVEDLAAHFEKSLPESPWLYPEDQMTDAPLRQLAAEITREKIFLNLHQELPYMSAVEIRAWKEKKDGSVRIEQTILCERDNHKGIIIGKGGAMLKTIGSQARKEIEGLLGKRVHLFLHVKVSPGWADKPFHVRSLGLEPTE